MDRTFSLILVYIIASCHPTTIGGEIFSATVHLPKLLHTQQIVIDRLDGFLEKENQIITHLNTFRNILQLEDYLANINRQRYVGNPINAFKLIKRLTADVQEVLENIDVLGLSLSPDLFPTDADLASLSHAIIRLQETYQLKAVDLARGFIRNKQYSTAMTASDCFSLGRVLYDNELHYYSNQWFLIVLEKIKSETRPSHNARRIALEYIALNNYRMDDLEEGLAWLEKIIEEYPFDGNIVKTMDGWQKELIERRKNKETTTFNHDEAKKAYNIPTSPERAIYEALCRGEHPLPLRSTKHLVCRFDNIGHPHLKISPFKAEEIFSDPKILVYHEVINDDEIEHIKTLAMSTHDEAKKAYNIPTSPERAIYEALCRGEHPLPLRSTKHLVCRFDNIGHPHLKISPFKAEEIFSDPKILVYHEVINDDEIEHIKTLAMSTHDEAKKAYNIPTSPERAIYEALCRGEHPLPLRSTKHLVCRFDNIGHPHLKISPFKAEEIFSDPKILVYHEVINDDEIEHIKTLAMSTLEWATVHASDDEVTSITKVDVNRVSQLSWLADAEDKMVARLSRRAGYIAHLSIESSELLQANVYGVGGHFTPHYDMFLKNQDETQVHEIGNRIATVMFYMSDVKRGGFTAFTRLCIAVKPKKGTAVVWRNLLHSGEADLRTRHAGCPVLLGSKWVLNKWLHEFGQEFIAPCGLQYQGQEDASE